jgi:hypothetical protein
VFVVSRFNPRDFGRRLVVGVLLAFALFFDSAGTLLAGTTGTITGTVTDGKTGTPLAGVRVTVVSPTGQYSGKTDARGFVSFIGVTPDTYTVSYEISGYQPASLTGVNVFADQITSINTGLQKSLKTIGSVSARSPGGAFQPTQTQDTYTVSSNQITTLQGKANAVSETNLLVSLPGATLDSSGYPVLRGGRENEEGFQFEGIDYTDAFTSQFINSLAVNPGVGELQLIPGAGDASQGNSGTGVINLISKRGTLPAFGSIEVDALAQPFDHQLSFEYGFATPNNRISDYIAYTGTRENSQFGSRGTVAATLGTGAYYATNFYVSDNLTNNFYYKFGKDQQQQFQFFYQNQTNNFYGNYGGYANMSYAAGDPYDMANLPYYTGLNSYQFGQLTERLPGQPPLSLLTGCNQNAFYTGTAPPGQSSTGFAVPCYSAPLDRGPENYYQPNDVMKFQYYNNVNSSTFFTVKTYRTNAVVTFDFPFIEDDIFEQSLYLKQGGQRSGIAADATKQLNSQNLLQFGGKYEFLKPIYDQVDPVDGVLAASGALLGTDPGYEAGDFVNPHSTYCPTTVLFGGNGCGYLWNDFRSTGGPNWSLTGPGQIPRNNEASVTDRQDTSFYALDQFSPSDRLKINAGLRVDSANYQLPALTGCNPTGGADQINNPTSWYNTASECNYAPTGYHKDAAGNLYPYTTLSSSQTHPIVPEPRLALAYQLSKNDAVRAEFANSVEFASLGAIDLMNPVGIYSAYANVPAYNALSPNTPVAYCGIFQNGLCHSYAEQLRWDNQNLIEGVPIQPLQPETFTNWEASYSHQFPENISIKVTPFYRRGYNQSAAVAEPRIDPNTGQPLLNTAGSYIFGPSTETNLGTSKTTGLEFYATKEAAYGLSGSFSATYINEFSNVIPTSPSEDFFPSIPIQSLQLGNLYRVGFLAPFQATLALQYKTRNGFRINPVFSFNGGYPIGAGTLAPFVVNGVPYNVPDTNATAPFGSTGAPAYVDPLNPGTYFHPNIYATRGTPEGAAAGGKLSAPQMNTNISFEFSPPGSHNTFGLQIANLFNQLYGTPGLNARWQPVATGIGGPETGSNAGFYPYPELGIQSTYSNSRYGYNPYIADPNQTPLTLRFYYQLKL